MKASFLTRFLAKEVIILPLFPAGLFLTFAHSWQYVWITSLCICLVGMILIRLLLNLKSGA